MKTSIRQTPALTRNALAFPSSARKVASAAAFVLAIHSACAVDYTWVGPGANWNGGSGWTTSPSDDSTFPDDAGDNIIGNTSFAVTTLNGAFAVGSLVSTADTSGLWTIRTGANLTAGSLNITGALAVGTASTASRLALTSNTDSSTSTINPMALTIGGLTTVNSGSTLTLGGSGGSTSTQALGSLSANGLSIVGTAGTTTVSIASATHYSLGLVTAADAGIKFLNLNLSTINSGPITAEVTGLSSISGSSGFVIRAGSGAGVIGSAILKINSSGDYSSNAQIQNGTAPGTVAVLKEGAGTQTLTGASTYTGGTTITTGTLLASNTSGSVLGTGAINVGISGTLGGTGSVSGATTISGAIAPGSAGIEDLEIANSATWNGGVNWKFELGTANASDRLNITGVGNDFLKGSGSIWRFDFQNSGTAGNTYTLVDWADSTGFASGDFSFTNLASGLSGTFAINGSQLDFIVVPAPPPGGSPG